MSTTETSECKCQACQEREEQQNREDMEAVRRTEANQARKLFKRRDSLSSCLGELDKVPDMGIPELKLIHRVVCHVGVAVETEIRELADGLPDEYSDLSEAIRLLLGIVQEGGGVKYEADASEERVVLCVDLFSMDGNTWHRLWELRDVLADLAGFVPHSVACNSAPEDEIPF